MTPVKLQRTQYADSAACVSCDTPNTSRATWAVLCDGTSCPAVSAAVSSQAFGGSVQSASPIAPADRRALPLRAKSSVLAPDTAAAPLLPRPATYRAAALTPPDPDTQPRPIFAPLALPRSA